MNKYLILLITVSLSCSSCFSRKSNNDRKIKNVLILGNSIVAHSPLAEIGWAGDWGMAASARDSDFVHRLSVDIHKVDKSVDVSWGNLSMFENNYESYDLSQLAAWRNPDMLIIKISENVKYVQGMDEKFISRFDALIRYLTSADSTAIIIVEGYWPTPVNDMIRNYALQYSFPFVPLADLYTDDPKNSAIGLFEHEGVSLHPSDQGMRNIASRIWDAISDFFDKQSN